MLELSEEASKNKRIAKNTLLLYFRTFVTLLVGLYTGRVMLQALGVDNYGINNVVGGIVSMASLITGSMTGACGRYITFALGEGNLEKMKNVFSTTVNVQIIMSVVAVVVLEIVGVWFLNSTANIPEGRMFAANVVLHCSVVTMMLSLISVPYSATIVAHECMHIYAYMSIVEVSLKLAICYIIEVYEGDRLILLSLLMACIGIAMRLFYGWYCSYKFEEAVYHLKIDKFLLKEMASYSGWNLLGNGVTIMNTHGVNMLINVFFGVAYNAARGVAATVNGYVQQFVGNFTMAFTPQITKSYAAGDLQYTLSLARRGIKFSWLLMFVFIVPVCMETDTLLKIWLAHPPEYAALFLRLALFESLAWQSGITLVNVILATGNVKRYQIEISLSTCIVFPITWLLYYMGAPVWSCYCVYISVLFFVNNYVRIMGIKRLMTFSTSAIFKDVYIPCVLVSVASFILPIVIGLYWEDSLVRFFVLIPISILWTLLCAYYLGLNNNEKKFVVQYVKDLVSKSNLI